MTGPDSSVCAPTPESPSLPATASGAAETSGAPAASGASGASEAYEAAAVSHAVAAVARARATFRSGRTKPYAWRVGQLESLRRMVVDNTEVLTAALASDLGKSPTESIATEIGVIAHEIDHVLANLRGWLRPTRLGVPLSLPFSRAKVIREPLGVVLVIAPWNYPVQLTLSPLLGAIAGGNAVVLKPSELAPATSRALAALLPAYLDPEAVVVVEGGVPETTALLAQRLDHILYTGNGTVGRVVLAAAVQHLTPVTLELGGKSPTYVDESADLEVAARRIAWGKFTNAGQTCVAPDYVLATASVIERLEPLLCEAIREFFGDDPSASPDYGRMVNVRHLHRVAALVESERVVTGGVVDPHHRYLSPTVTRADADSPVMQEEIFGPVLPLVEVADLDEAIDFVNERDQPLALYVFASDPAVRRRFERETSSGALNINLPLAHLVVPDLPFGGVGASGMGSYHGRASLERFTHAKPVLVSPTRPDTTAVVYPPSTGLRGRLAARLLAPRPRRSRRRH